MEQKSKDDGDKEVKDDTEEEAKDTAKEEAYNSEEEEEQNNEEEEVQDDRELKNNRTVSFTVSSIHGVSDSRFILLTFCILKFDKSIFFKELHS